MNQKQLIESIAEKAGLSKKKAKIVLQTFLGAVKEGLNSRQRTSVGGLGVFKSVASKPRYYTLPNGERIFSDSRKRVKFVAGKHLRKTLNPQDYVYHIDNSEQKQFIPASHRENLTRYCSSHKMSSAETSDATHNIREKDNGLITGLRKETELVENKFQVQYFGETVYGEIYHEIYDRTKYPNLFIPAKGTPVLAFHPTKRQTRGVTENIYESTLKSGFKV